MKTQRNERVMSLMTSITGGFGFLFRLRERLFGHQCDLEHIGFFGNVNYRGDILKVQIPVAADKDYLAGPTSADGDQPVSQAFERVRLRPARVSILGSR